MRLLLLTLSLLSSACSSDALRPVLGEVRVTPAQVDFGRRPPGESAHASLEVTNTGTAVDVSVTVSGSAFFVDAAPERLAQGSNVVALRFTPDADGPFDGVCTITAAGHGPLVVPLAGEGSVAPTCEPAGVCRHGAWDWSAGRCVTTPVDDGAPCEAPCLTEGRCEAGRCVGEAVRCDDDDPCTVDACDVVRGCVHDEATRCPSAGPCQVGRCDSQTGCGLAPAADGTPCGPRRDCEVAQVCLDGACVARRPPDGFVCAEASPCQAEGRCAAGACAQPPPVVLEDSWRVAGATDGGTDWQEYWDDLIVDPGGRVTLSSYFMSPPWCDARGPSSQRLGASARRCMGWRSRLVCLELGAGGTTVTVVDPSTGGAEWTYGDIRADVPAIDGPGRDVFLARALAQSPTALLVVWEARTLDVSGSDPGCRHFALGVLDASGHFVAGRAVEHPMFETCNHPHPYGAAVDAAGNSYFAFTPSQPGASSPARAQQSGTVLMSFTPSLALRWVRDVGSLRGGALAVGGGRLFHEFSSVAFDAATGVALTWPPYAFGGGVIGDDVVVPQPGAGGAGLSAFALSDGSTRWAASPTWGSVSSRAPLVMAGLQTSFGPRAAVLSFDTLHGQRRLLAHDVGTGASLFSCPIDVLGEPGLVEVGPGGLAVGVPPTDEWGAFMCADCDPGFAMTQVRFQWFDLPGVTGPVGRWPSRAGGAGNDGREDATP